MQRTIGRVRQRLRGTHPRRPASRFSFMAEIACDLLLAVAGGVLLFGFVVVVWAMLNGLPVVRLVAGVALMAFACVLLALWERLAWEPFVERLSRLS